MRIYNSRFIRRIIPLMTLSWHLWWHYLYGVHVDVFTDYKSLQYVFTHRELKLRQEIWLEMLKDYDMNIHYHLGKANVVAYALSKMRMGSTTHFKDAKKELVKDLHRLARLGVRLVDSTSGGVSINPSSESSLVFEVMEGHHLDPVLMEMKDSVLVKINESFALGDDNIRRYHNMLCVLDVDDLWTRIIIEAHGSRFSIYPGSTKMYHDHKQIYWWDGMKKDIADYVSKCPNCQQVKAEHLKHGGLTQIIDVSTWKWEVINMDYVVGLPKTRR